MLIWAHIFFQIAFYAHASGCFVRGALPGEAVTCEGYNSIYYAIYGGALYYIERIWREISGRKPTEIIGVLLHASGTLEIRFRKPGMKYVPGQWIFIQVPEVSRFQWHPFTISSAPDDPYISIHVRQVGDFTKQLSKLLGATPQLSAQIAESIKGGFKSDESLARGFFNITRLKSINLPVIRVDGPYGAPAEDVFDCEIAILIGAGIGVTPFSSILKNI